MALFMKLMGADGVERLINFDQVTQVVRFPNAGYTAIYFDHENIVTVKDTPQSILSDLPQSAYRS